MHIHQGAKADDHDLVERIEQASPEKLHAMLLEVGQKFLNLAILAMNNNDVPGKFRHLSRVSEIILELSTRLNQETGGDLSANLGKIYAWWNDVLFEASQNNQVDRFQMVAAQMGEMQTSWEGLAASSGEGGAQGARS